MARRPSLHARRAKGLGSFGPVPWLIIGHFQRSEIAIICDSRLEFISNFEKNFEKIEPRLGQPKYGHFWQKLAKKCLGRRLFNGVVAFCFFVQNDQILTLVGVNRVLAIFMVL